MPTLKPILTLEAYKRARRRDGIRLAIGLPLSVAVLIALLVLQSGIPIDHVNWYWLPIPLVPLVLGACIFPDALKILRWEAKARNLIARQAEQARRRQISLCPVCSAHSQGCPNHLRQSETSLLATEASLPASGMSSQPAI